MTQEQVLRPRAPMAQQPRKADRASKVRNDPAPRHVDGLREGRLSFSGPMSQKTHHFVLVNKAADHQGIGYYEDLGYVIVRSDDQVNISGRRRSATADGAIEYRGHVLMACAKDRRDEIEMTGPGGDTGLEFAARMESQIVNQKSAIRDSLRGLDVGSQHMSVKKFDLHSGAGEEEG